MKGRGQTAAEEATQRRTGVEKMSEWEISPTLEDRSVLSGRMRGKNWRERKKARTERGRNGRENKKRANKERVMEKRARYRPPASSLG